MGGLVVHACQESTNLSYGERGRNKVRLFKACNYVCSMRSRKKPSPAVTEGSVLHTAALSTRKSAKILLGVAGVRGGEILSATQTYWRLYMGRGVSQVRVFCAPSREFPQRISDEE